MGSKKFKYLDDKIFKQDTFQALSSQFQNEKEFEIFYKKLKDDKTKNEFLRTGTTYLFFVKSGDWHVNVERSNPVIEYFTNSFKLVSLLAVAESVENKRHIDFFSWLNKKKHKHLFPIENQADLEKHYRVYKQEYGSIYSVKDFFNNLSQITKDNLCKRVTVNGEALENIEELIKLVYSVRSNFAHSVDHNLELSDGFHFSGTKKKRIVWRQFKIEYLQEALEEGIITYFRSKIL
jgi:hypothetical protein